MKDGVAIINTARDSLLDEAALAQALRTARWRLLDTEPLQGLFTLTNTNEPHAVDRDLFRYTPGRWLYNEKSQLERRYLKFNVQPLKQKASEVLGAECIEITKLPEGPINKVFLLKSKNGREVLAKIPNPNAGRPQRVVSSEVATLDFLHTVLNIPVPKVVARGCKLSEVWTTIPEEQRFALIRSWIDIEKKLVSTEFSGYGNLYYKDTCLEGLNALEQTQFPKSKREVASKFVVGPTMDQSFLVKQLKSNYDLDGTVLVKQETVLGFIADELLSNNEGYEQGGKGLWRTADEYISTIACREIAFVRNSTAASEIYTPPEMEGPLGNHFQLLEKSLALLPYFLPLAKLTGATLMRHDLDSNNIFVDPMDPTK
ncbi:hypothetical protein BBP40_004448 [Aspergillus hancockii]|nr:hypothetical protein BBP40_004448 [Aspergillus hancockii]